MAARQILNKVQHTQLGAFKVIDWTTERVGTAATGAGGGVAIPYFKGMIIAVHSGTSTIFTPKVALTKDQTDVGITANEPTFQVGALAPSYFAPSEEIHKQTHGPLEGHVLIEMDSTAEFFVLHNTRGISR